MKRKILLVEDDLAFLTSLERLLEEIEGYEIFAASNISAAISFIEQTPDLKLVITDLHLPESNDLPSSGRAGVHFLEFIQSTKPNLPVIVLSGFVESYTLKDLLRLGVSAVFEKGDLNVVENLTSYIPKLIEEYESKIRREIDEASVLANIKKALVEEIERYSPIKEKTLYIPSEGSYELIKPLIGFKREIESQIAKFQFTKNVFLMMKFRDSNKDLGEYIIENLSNHGLQGVRADHDDWNITKNVYNPIAVLYCCKYGIALFDEPESYQAYSPNVAYELGMMHYQNKHCLILRHKSLPSVPFDLIKDLYVTYERDLQVKQIIASWIKQIAGHAGKGDA